MDVREKLVEQKIKGGAESICAKCFHNKVCKAMGNQPCIECNQFVDAHGVTVQEWIPASEPPKDDLPVLVTCGKGYRPFVARYDLIWKRWRVSHTLKITHWQPLPSTRDLPQPPKGE